MKRLLACLALCASLSAPAQDDNCTILGVQELSLAYYDLNASIDSITNSIVAIADSLSALNISPVIVEYDICWNASSNYQTAFDAIKNCVNSKIAEGWVPFGSGGSKGSGGMWQALVKYADD